MTLNIAWLKENYYPSTPPCPGAGVSSHTLNPTWLQPLSGHGHEQEGCSHGQRRNWRVSKELSTEGALFPATHFQSKRNNFLLQLLILFPSSCFFAS